jgi:cathepsin B
MNRKVKSNDTTKEVDAEEQRRQEESRVRKEEENRKRKEEFRELSERQQKQKEAAEEASKKYAKKKGSGISSYYIVFGVLGALCLYVIVMLFLNQQPPLNKTSTIDDKRIEEHNQNFPWQQGPNKFFEGSTLADAKKIINTSFASHSNLVRCSIDETITPPESFDARTQWPNCLFSVANQQRTCGASYAFATSQTAAERICIGSKTDKRVQLSPQELLSCDTINSGCKGGYLNNALDYMKTKGLVDEECFPYQADSDTVKCDKMCSNPTRERIDGYCILFGEDDIKREIYKSGPVVAATQVYVDFLTYKSGVYTKGDEVARFSGFHAIKIIGWGVESGNENEPNKGNKYWIIQNSWGDDWGEGGYAKVSMGQELMFDQYAYAIKVKSDKAPEKEQRTQQPHKEVEVEDSSNLNLDDDLNLDVIEPEDVQSGGDEDEKEKKQDM